MKLAFLSKYREAGLLLLRISVGLLFLYLGAPALTGGAARWAHLGSAVRHVGLHSHFAFWGFLAAIAESIGGVLLVIGFAFRLGLLLLLIPLLLHVAVLHRSGASLDLLLAPAEMGAILFALALTGPGKHSVDKN